MTTTRIPHDGGACPVSPGTKVTVWFRDGDVDADFARQFSSDDPDMNLWLHGADPQEGAEIIGYAILEPDWNVEGPKLVEALEGLANSHDNGWAGQTYSRHDVVRNVEMIARTALSRIKQGEW